MQTPRAGRRFHAASTLCRWKPSVPAGIPSPVSRQIHTAVPADIPSPVSRQIHQVPSSVDEEVVDAARLACGRYHGQSLGQAATKPRCLGAAGARLRCCDGCRLRPALQAADARRPSAKPCRAQALPPGPSPAGSGTRPSRDPQPLAQHPPGVLDTIANEERPVRRLMRLLLPTFDRPMTGGGGAASRAGRVTCWLAGTPPP